MPAIQFHSTQQHFGADGQGALGRPDKPASITNNRSLITCCFVFIAVVSALDMYLVTANQQILKAEQNPICLALMQLEPDTKIYFFIGKTTGSLGVLLTLYGLLASNYRHARVVLAAVAAFQLGLLCYLYLGDSRIGGFPNFALLFRDTPESIFKLDGCCARLIELSDP